VIEHADREKVVTDDDLARIVAQTCSPRRAPASQPVADFASTPAEVGYGHGV
jgi:hypothetical protein